MQLAIIEQFQKKKPLLYHFEKKKTIMEPFSGKQLILRKGKSCLYWCLWRTCSETGSPFQLQWEIVAKKCPLPHPFQKLQYCTGLDQKLIHNIGLQGYVDFVGEDEFCVKRLLLETLSIFGEGVLFTYKESEIGFQKFSLNHPEIF